MLKCSTKKAETAKTFRIKLDLLLLDMKITIDAHLENF